MKTHDCVQYSPEWWALRRGRPTASAFDRILTPVQRKPSAGQGPYLDELLADLLDPEAYTAAVLSENGRTGTPAMERGRVEEPNARNFYAVHADADVVQVGFVTTDDGRFGCSPDGLVPGRRRGLELKCPLLKTHLGWLRETKGGRIPQEYLCQVHGCMVVTGFREWDFLSYAPPAPPLVVTATWDDFTDRLAEELEVFWAKLKALAGDLTRDTHPED